MLARHLKLYRSFERLRYGLTVQQLLDITEVSRATLYRDIATLRQAGLPIWSDTVNGEARYRLDPNSGRRHAN